MWSLVDSGAQICALSQKLYEDLSKQNRIQCKPSYLKSARTADGSKVSIVGKVDLEFKLMGIRTPSVLSSHQFHVIPYLGHYMIIGADFFFPKTQDCH